MGTKNNLGFFIKFSLLILMKEMTLMSVIKILDLYFRVEIIFN